MEIESVSESENEEWEILDYYCYEDVDGDEEKQQGWWKMGNWVMEAGKKLVMTGVVISSAPVVLPPLFVVSALGFAMSLPFGAVFASYACTHKIMTKLLPPPPPAYEQDQETVKTNMNLEEEEEMMREDIKKEMEMRIGLVGDENDVQMGTAEDGINTKTRLEEEGEREMESSDHDQESITSTSTSSENGDGSPQIINIDEEKRQTEELDREKVKQKVVLMDDDDKQHNKATQLPTAATDLQPDHKGEEDASEAKMGGDKGSKRSAAIMNGVSDKELESKIEAIRVIVGFKAPRRSSYVEEVKALYLFTGIDPPNSSISSSISELDHNISFLMSVIGLK